MAKGLLKGIATVLVAGILAGGVCAAGYASRDVNGAWFRESDLKAWTLKDKNKPTDTTAKPWGGVIDGVGNELNATTTYAMPAAMAFYSNYSDDVAQDSRLSSPSVTVTCSHNFEFNNVLVDWSVEYPSGASAADVVTVTPTSDGSLTANVSCTAPAGFDTQLTLKATLRGNEEKTATCTIDYIKRISSFINIFINASDFKDDTGIGCNPIFGIGTVKGNLRVKSITWHLKSEFEEKVQSYLKFPITLTSHYESNKDLNEENYYDGDTLTYAMLIQNFDDYDQAHKNAIYYAWCTAYNDYYRQDKQYSNIALDIEFELLYNGNVIQNYGETDYLGGTSRNYISGDYCGEDLAPDLTLNTNVAL